MKTQETRRLFRLISPMVMAALVIQLLIPIAGLAQTDQGRIVGTVRDQGKAVDQGVRITVVHVTSEGTWIIGKGWGLRGERRAVQARRSSCS